MTGNILQKQHNLRNRQVWEVDRGDTGEPLTDGSDGLYPVYFPDASPSRFNPP